MGSSKKVTVGYKYFLGLHLVGCLGPIDALRRIEFDARTAWNGFATGGRIRMLAETLFGGTSREGGVSGDVDVEMGGLTQPVNDYIVAQTGQASAHRGVFGLVLRQCYLGMNPYLKPITLRAQRIHVRRAEGLPQWYDEKAQIGTLVNRPLGLYFALDISQSMDTMTSNGQTRLQNAKTALNGALDYIGVLLAQPAAQRIDIMIVGWWGATLSSRTTNLVRNVAAGNIASLKSWVSGLTSAYGTAFPAAFQDLASFTAGSPADADIRVIFITDGEPFVDGYSAQLLAEMAADLVAEAPSAHVHGVNIDLEDTSYTRIVDNTPEDEVPVVSGADPGALTGVIINALGGQLDLNAAHLVRELLSDADFGLGEPEEEIDDDNFTAVADTLHSESFGLSFFWQRQEPVEEFLNVVSNHIDGHVYIHRATGKWQIKLVRADYDQADLLRLDESNVERVEDVSRPAFGDLATAVTVNYWDHATGKEASLTVSDPALAIAQGRTLNTTVYYPGITNATLASRVASRDLRALSSGAMSCTVYANREASELNPGDPFVLDFADAQAHDMVMRVTEIGLGDGRANKVRIRCTQDVFSMPSHTVLLPPADPGWQDPSGPPRRSPASIAFEVPYYELVQAQGQTAVDGELGNVPEAGALGVAALRPSVSALNAVIATDAGAGFEEGGSIDFCPGGVLAADIGPLDTEIELSSGVDLDLVQIGTHCQVGDELVAIVAREGNAFNIKRGILDTVPVSHAAGTRVFFWDAFVSAADATEYAEGETVDVKVMPVTGQGQLPLSSAPTLSVTMAARAIRPYPPGNVQFNGEYFPDEVVGNADIAVTFATRNRLQQTAGTFLGFLDGAVTPEAGVDYVAEAYQRGTDTLIWTGVSAASPLTVPANSLSAVSEIDFRLYSRRDGLLSYQFQLATFSTAGSVVEWTPLMLPNLVAWYDGESPSNTLVGGLMDTLYDLSGHGNHAPAYGGVAANRGQVYGGSLNGRRVWGYDTASRKALFSSSASHVKASGNDAAGLSVFTVSAAQVTAAAGVVGTVASLTTGASDTNTRIQVARGFVAANAFYGGGRRLDADVNVAVSDNADYGLGWHVAGCINNYLARSSQLYVDGNLAAQNSAFQTAGYTSATDSQYFHVGGTGSGSGPHLGRTAEIVLCRGALADSDRQMLEGYMAHKWGLQSQLPPSHPYKASPATVVLVGGVDLPVITAPRVITEAP